MSNNTIALQHLQMNKQGYIQSSIDESDMSIDSIEIIKMMNMNNDHVITEYHKDDELKDKFNELLGTQFKIGFRCTRNKEEPIGKDDVPLEGDILLVTPENKWIALYTSEWGSITRI